MSGGSPGARLTVALYGRFCSKVHSPLFAEVAIRSVRYLEFARTDNNLTLDKGTGYGELMLAPEGIKLAFTRPAAVRPEQGSSPRERGSFKG